VEKNSRDALIEFANHFRQPGSPGTEVIEAPRYRLTLIPDLPVPGPNSVAWIRCRTDEVSEVIDEVHRTVAPRHLPLMWITDPETEPPDLAERLAARGILPDEHAPESAVMVLPTSAEIESRLGEGVAIRDALESPEAYLAADRVNAEAFRSADRTATLEQRAALERRRLNQIAAGNRRWLLITVDGEPAGSGGLTLYPPHGAIINGGAVRPKFRGRGIYRALVAKRLEMARAAGAPGMAVWGGPMSAPILFKLGFEKVGWRRFYVDPSTA